MGKISAAEVLRLRATSAVLSNRSVRRFAQDDDSVVGIKNIGSSAKTRKDRKVTSSHDDESVGGTNGTEIFVREPGHTAGPSAPPDFLSKIVASMDFLRLSLRRAAYVAAGRAVK